MRGEQGAGPGKPDPDEGETGGECTEIPETENSGGVGEGSELSECTRRPGDGRLGGTRTGRLLGTTYVRASGAFIFEPGDTIGGKLSPTQSDTESENEPRHKEGVETGVGEQLAEDEVEILRVDDVPDGVVGAGRRESTEQSTTNLYLWRKG